jgi:hypothetical protein
VKGIVPFPVERRRNKVDLGHLGVGNPSPFRIGPFIEPTLNSQPRLGRGGRDQLDNDLMRHQRLAPPVLRDKGKEPMLDLVPLPGSRRQMADFDGHLPLVGESLQRHFPEPQPRAIAASTIGNDQE